MMRYYAPQLLALGQAGRKRREKKNLKATFRLDAVSVQSLSLSEKKPCRTCCQPRRIRTGEKLRTELKVASKAARRKSADIVPAAYKKHVQQSLNYRILCHSMRHASHCTRSDK